MKAGSPIKTMVALLALAFAFAVAMVGCTSLQEQEQERAGAPGGEEAARSAREAKSSRLVRYAGAQDLYTVSGSPVHAATLSERPDQVEHRAAH